MYGDNGILGHTKQASKDADESYVIEVVNTSYNAVAIDYGISTDTIKEFYSEAAVRKRKR